MTRRRAWKIFSSLLQLHDSPLLAHDDDDFPPGHSGAVVAAKLRPPPSHVAQVLPAEAADPVGGGLRAGDLLAGQRGDDDLASRIGLACDAACAADLWAGGLYRLAFHQARLFPPRKSI